MNHKITHQWLIIFDSAAKTRFDTLSKGVKRSIFRQLRELLIADDPYSVGFVEMLKDKKFQRLRRFRVGDFRILFAVEALEVQSSKHLYKGTLFVVEISDRKESY